MTTGPGDILPQHRFDEAAVATYLQEHLPGFAGPVSFRQFRGGQSNPTFLAETPSKKYVIRKKPPGVLLPSAHMIEREFQAMQALAGTGVPAPNPLLLCTDASVMGTPFYVMDFVAGRIFDNPSMPGATPAERTQVYTQMATTLAKLHGVDWRGRGLEKFGKPDGYVRRQIERWGQQYIASKTVEIPGMDKLMAWLPQHLTVVDEAALVHGDYRLGNLIIDGTRVAAIVDWELATLGHPLSDLAYACMAYHLPPQSEVFQGLAGLDLKALGIPDEQAFVDIYRRETGRGEIPNWPFYMAYSLFRICAICQGVYARGLRGNASDAAAQKYGEVAKISGEIGWSIAANIN